MPATRTIAAARPLVAAALIACGGDAGTKTAAADSAAAGTAPAAPSDTATDAPLATREGFSGPEAVRYDAEQDVYFVSNFNGSGSARDNNGFVSRMSPDGEIQQLRFVAGGAGGATLHAPRGMAITGDTLWVADVDGVAGFHRRTGAPVGTVTFPGETLGFLNDVAAGPDGTLYVTDTGTNRVYRIDGRTPRVLVSDSTLGGPNGITWDAAGGRLLVVPYGGGGAVRAVDPTTGTMTTALTLGAAKMDGVEVLPGGRMLIATQSDSSLHLVQGGTGRRLLRTAGQPADIGVDTRRNRVAVPYIALNRVDVWALPGRR